MSVNNILGIKFCLVVEPTSGGSVYLLFELAEFSYAKILSINLTILMSVWNFKAT